MISGFMFCSIRWMMVPYTKRKCRKTSCLGERLVSKMCFQDNQIEMLCRQLNVSSYSWKGIPTTFVHLPTDEDSRAVLFKDCDFLPNISHFWLM